MNIEQRLRYRILGLLHAGQIQPGDRLPSIRQVTAETGFDHRAVSAAYRALEEEGFVEVRAGSGVYLANLEPATGILHATETWLADLFADSWARGVSRAEFGKLVARCARARVRCACVESNEDSMVALTAELEQPFGVEAVPVMIASEAAEVDPSRYALDGVNLVVTSVFHERTARALGRALGVPVQVITIHREFAAEVDRRLSSGPVTAVHVDPAYAERAQAYLAPTRHAGQARLLAVAEARAAGVDFADPSVLVTRAARRALRLEDYHLVPAPPGVIAPDTARALTRLIVRSALERSR